jgi:acetyltransferase-like isoleucine patch superfamily enzyme
MIGLYQRFLRTVRNSRTAEVLSTGHCCFKADNATISAEGRIENLQSDPAAIQVGENSFIRGQLLVYRHGGQIMIGQNCYVGHRSEIWSMNSVSIGDRVLISHDCQIHDGTAHSLDPMERAAHFRAILLEGGHPQTWADLPGVRSAPIVIEDDVWISFGVTILKGVRIGKGAVIGAMSIVTKDVEPYMLYHNEVKPRVRPLIHVDSSRVGVPPASLED